MFRKIILTVLIIVISVVGYLLISNHKSPNDKIIKKIKSPLVAKVTYFYVYKNNEKKGDFLSKADLQKEELKPGQKNTISSIKPPININNINFNKQPIMRLNKTKGQTITDKDYSFPGNSDYGVLLSIGRKDLPFQITVHQAAISKYVFVGGRVDVYILISINSNLGSGSDHSGLNLGSSAIALKSKIRFKKLLSKVLVLGIKSTDSMTYKIDLSVSSDKMQELLLGESVGRIFILPPGKSKNNAGQKLLSSFGFNNVIEIHA